MNNIRSPKRHEIIDLESHFTFHLLFLLLHSIFTKEEKTMFYVILLVPPSQSLFTAMYRLTENYQRNKRERPPYITNCKFHVNLAKKEKNPHKRTNGSSDQYLPDVRQNVLTVDIVNVNNVSFMALVF